MPWQASRRAQGQTRAIPAVPLCPLISVGWPCVGLWEGMRTDQIQLLLLLLTDHAQTLTWCCHGLSFPFSLCIWLRKRILHWCQAKQESNHFPDKQMCQNHLFLWGPTNVFHDLGSLTHDEVGNVQSSLTSETPRCCTFIQLTTSICPLASFNRKKYIHIFPVALPLVPFVILSKSIPVNSWAGPCGRGLFQLLRWQVWGVWSVRWHTRQETCSHGGSA